jgi:cytochrome c oxidase subunit 2
VRFWSLVFALAAIFSVGAFVYAPFAAEWWLPAGPDGTASHLHSASTAGKEIDLLFVIVLVITGVVFIGTQIAMVVATARYGDKGEGEGKRKAHYSHGSKRLELIWTIVPSFFLVFITVYQMGTWASVKYKSHAPGGPPLAEVTARQFQWEIRYAGPDGTMHTTDDLITANDLHFVKGEMVLIQLKSSDVLHSFFLPQLRIKQDAVPGLSIPVWFDADQAGKYELACAELCGWGHYLMKGNVTVHATRREYDEWMASALKEQSRDQVAVAAEGTRGEP